MSRTKYYRCDAVHDEYVYFEVGDEWACPDCGYYYCSEDCYESHKENDHNAVRNAVRCWSCGTTVPDEEAVRCQGVVRYDESHQRAIQETCERALCEECYTTCSHCEDLYCSDHTSWCEQCEESFCDDAHIDSCYRKHNDEYHQATPDQDTDTEETPIGPVEEVPEVEVMWE